MLVEVILGPINLTLRRAQSDENRRNDRVDVVACHISSGVVDALFGGEN